MGGQSGRGPSARGCASSVPPRAPLVPAPPLTLPSHSAGNRCWIHGVVHHEVGAEGLRAARTRRPPPPQVPASVSGGGPVIDTRRRGLSVRTRCCPAGWPLSFRRRAGPRTGRPGFSRSWPGTGSPATFFPGRRPASPRTPGLGARAGGRRPGTRSASTPSTHRRSGHGRARGGGSVEFSADPSRLIDGRRPGSPTPLLLRPPVLLRGRRASDDLDWAAVRKRRGARLPGRAHQPGQPGLVAAPRGRERSWPTVLPASGNPRSAGDDARLGRRPLRRTVAALSLLIFPS